MKPSTSTSKDSGTIKYSCLLFIRALALTYLLAFVSLWFQAEGLFGSEGIVPAKSFLAQIAQNHDIGRFWAYPTLLWLNSSDVFIHLLLATGTLCSIILCLGYPNRIILLILWAVYLSVVIGGQEFTMFQGDLLLLEVGFLSIFLAERSAISKRPGMERTSPVVILLFKMLLFRVFFVSGLIHILSNLDSWLGLVALDSHFLTQPLPTQLSYYPHFAPLWCKKAFSFGVILTELLLPFLFFAARPLRIFAGVMVMFSQLFIFFSGNYAWYPILISSLALFLFDDRLLGSLVLSRIGRPKEAQSGNPAQRLTFSDFISPLPLVVIFLTSVQFFLVIFGTPSFIRPFIQAASWARPFHLVNFYEPFGVNISRRFEVVVEGSNDLENWKEYHFKWKPGDISRAPGVAAPHHPRLDWTMWHLAIQPAQHNPWFFSFLHRILEASPQTLALLAENPFPKSPPRYVRALFYEYKFTGSLAKETLGDWWQRELLGLYAPPLSLENFKDTKNKTESKDKPVPKLSPN